jgi:hypothetical protein
MKSNGTAEARCLGRTAFPINEMDFNLLKCVTLTDSLVNPLDGDPNDDFMPMRGEQ